MSGPPAVDSTFDALPLAAWVYDPDTLAILAANHAAVSQYGYSRDEFVAMRITDLRPAEDVPELLAFLEARRRTEVPRRTWKHRRKDGSSITVDVHSSAISFAGRDARLSVSVDVTEEHRVAATQLASENELVLANRELEMRAAESQRMEATFRAMVEVAPQHIIAIDERQTVVLFNARAREVFGYESFEVIGLPLEKLLPDRAREEHTRTHVPGFAESQVVARRMAERQEVFGRRKDGSEFPAEVGLSRVAAGERTMLMAVLEDVTDRRKHEHAVRALNEHLERRVSERTAELEAATRELEAFTYSVSHDLRAPLRAIDGFSGILQEEHAASLPREAQRYLEVVRANAQRMGRLVDDLLAFSRLRNAQLKREPLDLGALAREVIAELEGDAEGRDVRFHIPELPVVEGDRTLLRQVLHNLVGNALKFTKPRAIAEIEVGVERAEGDHVYFVRDNGVGFDMEYAGKMFGVFQRLHRDDEFEGTGVGLAIVQNIVTRHGGRVWADAQVDGGATIYFTLGGTHE